MISEATRASTHVFYWLIVVTVKPNGQVSVFVTST
jgi:hypothetical protein